MLKDIIKKVPGYRTGTKWRMIVATIGYLFVLDMLITIPRATLYDKFLYILEFLLIFGIPFVLVTNTGEIRSKLPIFNKKSFKFTILGGVIVLIIIIMGTVALENLKSPEQKHLDYITNQPTEVKKAASDVDAKITALGDVNAITLDKAGDVKAARTAYEALTSDEKGLITQLALLGLAEKRISDLQAAAADKAAADKAAADKAAADKAAADKYDNAVAAFNDKKYYTAYALFVSLGDYSDSANKALACIQAYPSTKILYKNSNYSFDFAPLSFVNTDIATYIKIYTTSGTLVATMFIHSGETLDITMPEGSYIVKDASGSDWFGTAEMFGDPGTYVQLDNTFNFSKKGSGYEVTLKKIEGGNLGTIPENRDGF